MKFISKLSVVNYDSITHCYIILPEFTMDLKWLGDAMAFFLVRNFVVTLFGWKSLVRASFGSDKKWLHPRVFFFLCEINMVSVTDIN